MKNYRVTYIFENERVIPYLENKVKIGRFTFSPSESERGFYVSYLVQANSIEEARKNQFSKELSEIFSLFERRGINAREISIVQASPEIKDGHKTKQFSQSFLITGNIKYKVDKKSLDFCNKIIIRLHRFSNSNQIILERSLHFFSRGANDYDDTDAFLDYWISLENLIKLYGGKVTPAKCAKCGHVYEPRPIRTTLQFLLKRYGLKNKLKEFNTLNQLRADLVHARINHISSEDTLKTRNLVKSLLLKILK